MNYRMFVLQCFPVGIICLLYVGLGNSTDQSQQEPRLFDLSMDRSVEKVGWPEEDLGQEEFTLTNLGNTKLILPADIELEGPFQRLIFLKEGENVRTVYVEFASGSRGEIVKLATTWQERLNLGILEDDRGDTTRLLQWEQSGTSESIMACRRINYPMIDMIISKVIGKNQYKLSFWFGKIRSPISNDLVKAIQQIRERDVDWELLRLLDPNSRGVQGDTLLHHCARQGLTEVAAQLIETGAEVDSIGIGRQTPLCSAVVAGELDSAALLISKGADIHWRAADGSTLVHLVAKGHTRSNRAEMLTWLLNQGVNVDAMDDLENTALHYSRSRGFPKIEELLIGLGADTKIRNRAGNLFHEEPGFLSIPLRPEKSVKDDTSR